MARKKPASIEMLNRNLLRRMADHKSFERGEDYYYNGRVRSLDKREGPVTAKVSGTRSYNVKLWDEGGEVGYSCTCPVGQSGEFCKHCVAVGLEILNVGGKPSKSKGNTATMDDVKVYLTGLDKGALVDMLIERAGEDHQLSERLFMKTAKARPGGLDTATIRRAIDHAVNSSEFVDYHSAYEYAMGIEDVVRTIRELLQDGHAVEVVELAEYMLASLEKAFERVDDADGAVGMAFEEIAQIHLSACKVAKPDPETLAWKLFSWEVNSDYGLFIGAVERYKEVLGKKGLEAYKIFAEAAWRKVPLLGPSEKDPEKHGRYNLTHIMEKLAELSGDIEALVSVKSRDLSEPYSFLHIAEIYKQAGKRDLALEWAEKGVCAFPKRTDSRLSDFLASEYHRCKRHDEAIALIWAQYVEHPNLTGYQKLKAHADKLGQWDSWREKAVAFMRKTIEASRHGKRNGWWSMDNSELVSIYLWEGDTETAWREAKSGGCSEHLWMKLAKLREKDCPEDAISVYMKMVEPTLAGKNNDAYKEAVGLLRKIHGLMTRISKGSDFAVYLESVRKAHKPKRNFMKMLDAAKWG